MKAVRWPLWALASKKFQVNLTLHKLEDISPAEFTSEDSKLVLVVKWKGPTRHLAARFRRKMKTEQTSEVMVAQGSVTLEKEFENVCALALRSKDRAFQPWHVWLVIRKVTANQPKGKCSAVGKAVVDLSMFAPPSGDASQMAKIPVICHSGDGSQAILFVTFNFVELFTPQENGSEGLHWIVVPKFLCIGANLSLDKDDVDEIRILKRAKKKGKNQNLLEEPDKKAVMEDLTAEEKLSPMSDESSYGSIDVFELDSLEDHDDDEDDGYLEDINIQNSLGYGTIAGTNLIYGKTFSYDSDGLEGEHEFSEMLSLHKSPINMPKLVEETSSSDSDQTLPQSSMKSLLYWRKRKLSFRSPQTRGEPLLNKAYGEEGGDEIDWDRRQCGSPLEPLARRINDEDCGAMIGHADWDFGESFRVGNWEQKEIFSRDSQMKLHTEVFFASIDQRSESAAGESACTALVAVIADWLHGHPNIIPSRTEFNTLIRVGSAEWRKLCEEEAYKDCFPDRHFDLETIIQAAVRPLSVVSEKSFVGFFQPDGLGDSGEFLQGAMSFDSIWSEIECSGPAVYIVSWNDHFFILKVEESRCYIIDTLGERLYEGCNQAYILKFDEGTSLCRILSENQQKTAEEHKPASSTDKVTLDERNGTCNNTGPPQDGSFVSTSGKQMEETISPAGNDGRDSSIPQEQVVYSGMDACREFVKGFFAALPLRELQADLKKGLQERNYIFRRLQIEFHFTSLRSYCCSLTDLLTL
ncbi:hypothetical protein O6H91_12G038100 [Diphasiastrum complanatum]|uniref:Uncharacterized protein n=1 Tax=Diphasiastrum complanatum TaxID=34168 RepID=A0ACC2C0K3_DIPCM|nr:hypothetical protein O6H91_12G038100 [Diphasiastrum complanatum]